jgi:uncharacterized protein
VETDSIEEMICKDAELSALDRKLSTIYTAAARKAKNEHPPMLKAEQRGWIKGRDECWKADDNRSCVRYQYQRRIAELQAKYRLVEGNGPCHSWCMEIALDARSRPGLMNQVQSESLAFVLHFCGSGVIYFLAFGDGVPLLTARAGLMTPADRNVR